MDRRALPRRRFAIGLLGLVWIAGCPPAAAGDEPSLGIELRCREPRYCASLAEADRAWLREQIEDAVVASLRARWPGLGLERAADGGPRLVVALDREDRSVSDRPSAVAFFLSIEDGSGASLAELGPWLFRPRSYYELTVGEREDFFHELWRSLDGHLDEHVDDMVRDLLSEVPGIRAADPRLGRERRSRGLNRPEMTLRRTP